MGSRALWPLALLALLPGLARAETPDGAPADAGPADGAPAEGGPGEPALQAMAGHLVLDREGDLVHVTEVYVLVAEGRVEARPGELWIELPAGARAVEVSEGRGFAEAASRPGLELYGPIEPGRHALSFGFVVEAPEGEAMVAHGLPFDVQALHVVWAARQPLSARAMGFGDTGLVEIMGRRMRVLERGRPLRAGERLAILTTGVATSPPPEPAAASRAARDPLGALAPATLVLAALLLVAGLLLPPRLRLPGRSRPPGRGGR